MRDLTNQRFGRLIAIEPTPERKTRSIVWKCRCDCGREAFVPSIWLRRGIKQSCGCLQDESRRLDITGQTRGRLTAMYPTGGYEDNQTIWAWRCACGNILHKKPRDVGYGRMEMCPDCLYRIKKEQALSMGKRVERDEKGRSVKQISAIVAGKVTARNSSGVRGVNWHKGKQKWVVRVSNGKGGMRTIGYFDTIEAATYARKLAVEILYGKEDTL